MDQKTNYMQTLFPAQNYADKAKLAAKLVKILGALEGVAKKGYNKHQSYHYMREVDVMEALKAEFIKNNIILLTSSKLAQMSPKEKTTKDGDKVTEFITTVETTHTFVDAETGEQLPITSVGSGYDSTDKGAAKAITSAFKYALMKTFMISDEGADIENDGETKQAPVQAPRTSFNRPQNIAVKTTPIKEESPQAYPVTPETQPIEAPKTTPVKQQLNFGKRPTLQKPEPSFPQ